MLDACLCRTWVFDNSALPGEDPIEFMDVHGMHRRQFIPGAMLPPGFICMPRAYCVIPRLPGLQLEGKFHDDDTWAPAPAPFDQASAEFVPYNETARSSCAPGYVPRLFPPVRDQSLVLLTRPELTLRVELAKESSHQRASAQIRAKGESACGCEIFTCRCLVGLPAADPDL